MVSVVGLGTYPLAGVFHGGARRVRAIRTAYQRAALNYIHFAACLGLRRNNRVSHGGTDIVVKIGVPPIPNWQTVSDLLSGVALVTDESLYARIRKAVTAAAPAAIQLEQPFMYPVWQRMQTDGAASGAKLIYSAQNLEAALRRETLQRLGMHPSFVDHCVRWIERLESRCLKEAHLVISVSPMLAKQCAAITSTPIIVVANGVDEPRPCHRRTDSWRRRIPEGFAVTVGSDHAPNVHGFFETMVDGGMPYVPPRLSIVVCGRMAAALRQHSIYQQHRQTIESRVVLVPDLDDVELASIVEASRFVFVPITYGGGTNLKTAEAIASMKPVLATSQGVRGYEAFFDLRGFHVESTAQGFRRTFSALMQDPAFSRTPEERERCRTQLWQHTTRDLAPAVADVIGR